ncbi:thioesterase [Nocardioides sp. Soil805]|nr:thioesterase [Nocardioides sp. Soil805]
MPQAGSRSSDHEVRTNPVVSLWRRISRVPLVGPWLFSTLFAIKTPFAAAIKPRFVSVEPHRVALRVANRRRVRNHLGNVHATALCTGLETAAGTLAEATVPPTMRWIPRRMQVEYTSMARGPVTCTAETSPDAWIDSDPEVHVAVRGVLDDGTMVIAGVVTLWVTSRP